ncbi:MAG: FtsX-like permease family protein [Corynebacterium sp.]|nr:FtsX-like permease family protein [Corynebacterium sp.]
MANGSVMRKVSLRNIIAHKLRLVLTLLAVVLGTAFIASSFMFTNSLSQSFESAIYSSFDGVDAAVSPAGNESSISSADVQRITDDPQVAAVNARDYQLIVAANADAEPFQTGGGGSSIAPYYAPAEFIGKPYELVDGHEPQGTDQVVINDNAAQKYGIATGDRILLVTPQQRLSAEVVGQVKPPVEQGSTISLFMDHASYAEQFQAGGGASTLAVRAADNVTADDLVAHLNDTYPVKAESGATMAKDMADGLADGLKFINYFLVAFGLIALLVGTFIIANTFSMIVAQRTKEFALLRALGASRGQITKSVLAESAIVGFVGSGIGVLVGIGLVAVIKAVMRSQGMPLGSRLGLSLSAVLIPLVLGTIVTVVSAWAPARRAGSVEPVEAMRSTESAAGASLKVRTVIGSVVLGIGALCAIVGALQDSWETPPRAITIGVGAFLVIVGFFLAGPALSLPIVPTLGKIIGAPFGAMGSLAATNSKRNPRRTSATAFALTLGVALVTAIGMLGTTMNNAIQDMMESNVHSDFILSGPPNSAFPTPAETPDIVRGVDGVDSIVVQGLAPVTVDGQASYNYGPTYTQSVYLAGNPESMVTFDMTEGSANLEATPGFIAVDTVAESHNWKVGETYEVGSIVPGASAQAKLIGTFKANGVIEGLAFSESIVDEVIPAEGKVVNLIGVTAGEGVDTETLRTNLEDAVRDLLVVQVVTAQEFAGQATGEVNQMMNILYALLALAVIIAILGIINTLTLGVLERRQEIGMLRAVGTQRRQIRTMITLEAVQIAVFGAVMGILIGLGLGWAFIKVLADTGLGNPVVPWTQMAIILGSSAVVGVLAALWPASRAAKTPPLEAIAE